MCAHVNACPGRQNVLHGGGKWRVHAAARGCAAGTYEEYEEWQERRKKEQTIQAKAELKKPVVEVKTNGVQDDAKEQKKKIEKLSKEVKKLEEELEKIKTERQSLLDQLADNENYSDSEKLKQLQKKFEVVDKNFTAAHSLWEDSYMQLMELEE